MEHIYESETCDGEISAVLGPREEIIRCRDCKKSRENGWKCIRFAEELFDPIHEIGELAMANVNPDGFCAWAERDE